MIGTSAGGVPALQILVAGLPKIWTASVFVVMHIPPARRSELPEILRARGTMPVLNPQPNSPIEQNRIYVAPPDYHLLIERNQHISLWHGPKENNFRPAINPLFRSAADVYRERVVGVILTGGLDDGVAGLAWVKRHGGIAVVQDPREAPFPAMPLGALEYVPVDFVTPISEIASLLVQLADGSKPEPAHGARKEENVEKLHLIEATCPECRGPLTEVDDDGIVEFRCLVGHRYSPESLLSTHYEAEERALWAAVVGLEEATELVRGVIPHVSVKLRDGLERIAAGKLEQAKLIRNILENLKPYPSPGEER